MLPLRHLLYSERDVLSAARPVFKTNKQNNGTTDLSSQFRHHISVVVISVCLAFAVKIKWKEPTEIHPDRYNTMSFQLLCVYVFFFPSREVLSELKQSHWVHTAVPLVCSSVFISLSISQIASRRPAQLCFFTLRILPISKQTWCVHPRARGWLWCAPCLPACRGVNSNSNSSVLPLICLLQMLHWVSKWIPAPDNG